MSPSNDSTGPASSALPDTCSLRECFNNSFPDFQGIQSWYLVSKLCYSTMPPVHGLKIKMWIEILSQCVSLYSVIFLLLMAHTKIPVQSEYTGIIIVFQSVYTSLEHHPSSSLRTKNIFWTGSKTAAGLFFLSFSATPQGKLDNHSRL